jgi:hypothetical protein
MTAERRSRLRHATKVADRREVPGVQTAPVLYARASDVVPTLGPLRRGDSGKGDGDGSTSDLTAAGADAIGIFPNEASIIRLVGALILETSCRLLLQVGQTPDDGEGTSGGQVTMCVSKRCMSI